MSNWDEHVQAAVCTDLLVYGFARHVIFIVDMQPALLDLQAAVFSARGIA
jgi:hypothetical protein